MSIDQSEVPLTAAEFERIKARVHAEAGISLSEAKRTLVVSRLFRILRAHKFTSFTDYLDYLERDGSPAEAQEFVNALTTNLTRFFREDHHFTHLVEHVGGLIAAQKPARGDVRPRLRVWSAGCSTGQEPYTVALSLMAAYPELKRWDFRILATDIDTNVIARAATARYPASELNGLSPERMRLFERCGAEQICVPAEVAALVAFKPLNLLGAWPMQGPFDAIFCRNVTIYFDKPTQTTLFGRLGRMLTPGGYLYIGHAESVAPAAELYRVAGKTIYQGRAPQRPRSAA